MLFEVLDQKILFELPPGDAQLLRRLVRGQRVDQRDKAIDRVEAINAGRNPFQCALNGRQEF